MGWIGKLFGGKEPVKPQHVATRDDFERVVEKASTPVVLYVWGETCAPCHRMSHEVVRAATKHAGRVTFGEMSTSADRELVAHLGVRSTPTLIVFDRGEEVGRMTGFRPASWFDEMIAAEFPNAG